MKVTKRPIQVVATWVRRQRPKTKVGSQIKRFIVELGYLNSFVDC